MTKNITVSKDFIFIGKGSQISPSDRNSKTGKSGLCIPGRFNIHGDLFPYKCDLCPSEFKDNNEFKLHMKMHRNRIDPVIILCGMIFSTPMSRV